VTPRTATRQFEPPGFLGLNYGHRTPLTTLGRLPSFRRALLLLRRAGPTAVSSNGVAGRLHFDRGRFSEDSETFGAEQRRSPPINDTQTCEREIL
jgi:hypothetical protein